MLCHHCTLQAQDHHHHHASISILLSTANLPRWPTSQGGHHCAQDSLPSIPALTTAPSLRSQCYPIAIDQGVLILYRIPGPAAARLDSSQSHVAFVRPLYPLGPLYPSVRLHAAGLPRRPAHISDIARGSDTLHPTLII